MPVEDVVYSLLSNDAAVVTLVSTRITPGRASQKSAFPFVTYTRIASEHYQVLAGSAGFDRAMFQIDSWSERYDTARDVAEKIRLALQGFSGTVETIVVDSITLQEDRDRHFPPKTGDSKGIHSVSQDYYIWHEEAVPSFS